MVSKHFQGTLDISFIDNKFMLGAIVLPSESERIDDRSMRQKVEPA